MKSAASPAHPNTDLNGIQEPYSILNAKCIGVIDRNGPGKIHV